MKMKLKPREALIVHKALTARVTMLLTLQKNTKSKEFAKQLEATTVLRKRLFPASVIVED